MWPARHKGTDRCRPGNAPRDRVSMAAGSSKMTPFSKNTDTMETNDNATPQSDHPVFVLVHGAWHGAWCYAHVAAALAARGYLSI